MTETNATSHTGDAGEPKRPYFPPGRYGRRREPRPTRHWVPVALGVAVAALGVVAAVLLTQQYGAGRPYDVTVERFYDMTDSQVVVVFSVVVPEGETAICAVRARDADGNEVGRDEIRVAPPAGLTRPQVEHRLETTGPPVTGEVQRCWQEPQ